MKKYVSENDVVLLTEQVLNNEQKTQVLNNLDVYNINEIESKLSIKQDAITGTAGQFVVIGDDGNVTTKTVPNAEEASF